MLNKELNVKVSDTTKVDISNTVWNKEKFSIKFVLLAVVLLMNLSVFAQYPKYIIQFSDKNNSAYSFDKPLQFLSAKAIERRTKYHIAIDSTDLPVNAFYIDSVLSKGNVRFFSASKWLNQILIYTKDKNALAAIRKLPFVKDEKAIGYRHMNRERFEEIITPAIFTAKHEGELSYDYGASYQQVHIHNGEFLHNKGFVGSGITMAILDAGFNQYDKIDLFDSMRLNNQVLGVRDFVDFDSSVVEDDAHGRYCLSTIAANIQGEFVGTAPKTNFWLIRTEQVASEYPTEEHNWVVGAEFADSAGADMISSSLGYSEFDDPSFNHSYADFYKNSTMVTRGASMACNKGMIVTNSAGNEGSNSWKYIIFPADADSVCTVGAISANGNIASFSSYGYKGRVKPNVVSIGVNTVVAGYNGPVTGSGTSFANPNMAGLIACLWQAFPAYNNMTILNAVYKSADRYNNPDARYGFGIPDMKTAYRILKHQQNVELYGNDWLFAAPDPFTNEIDTRLIGRVDGSATLQLLDADGNIIATKNLQTEIEEVYNNNFTGLANVPPGNYFIKYKDSLQRRTLQLTKRSIVMTDWLQASPVPFHQQLNVYIKAPETAAALLRLSDASGRIIETKSLNVISNNYYTVQFASAASLPNGVYFVEYKTSSNKKTIRVVKQR